MMNPEALTDLCANWPVDRMEFESRTGKWKSSITGIALFPVDRTTVNLRFDWLPCDSSWAGPRQRTLTLYVEDFGFVRDEQYADRLSEAVLEFLDSESLSAEKQVLSAVPTVWHNEKPVGNRHLFSPARLRAS